MVSSGHNKTADQKAVDQSLRKSFQIWRELQEASPPDSFAEKQASDDSRTKDTRANKVRANGLRARSAAFPSEPPNKGHSSQARFDFLGG